MCSMPTHSAVARSAEGEFKVLVRREREYGVNEPALTLGYERAELTSMGPAKPSLQNAGLMPDKRTFTNDRASANGSCLR